MKKQQTASGVPRLKFLVVIRGMHKKYLADNHQHADKWQLQVSVMNVLCFIIFVSSLHRNEYLYLVQRSLKPQWTTSNMHSECGPPIPREYFICKLRMNPHSMNGCKPSALLKQLVTGTSPRLAWSNNELLRLLFMPFLRSLDYSTLNWIIMVPADDLAPGFTGTSSDTMWLYITGSNCLIGSQLIQSSPFTTQ